MIRSLLVALVGATPVLAQYSDPEVEFRMLQPGDRSLPIPLAARTRVFIERVDAGLIKPPPIEEALVDVEAWLRDPLPGDEVSRRRAGFVRPARGTAWREPITLPDEQALEQSEDRLRRTVRAMQGVWRVQRMVLDGEDLSPEAFAGLKYHFQDTVLSQSETSEQWEGVPPAIDPTPVAVAPAVPDVLGYIVGPMAPVAVRATATPPLPVIRSGLPTPEVVIRSGDLGRVGPAGTPRPAPAQLRNDPRQEESVRLSMLDRGEGRAVVHGWNRYGESVDPHNDTNRPSHRVAFPATGYLELTPESLNVRVQGVGLRAVLPTRFHKPLGVMRSLELVLVRDVQVTPVPKRNIIIPMPEGTIRPG